MQSAVTSSIRRPVTKINFGSSRPKAKGTAASRWDKFGTIWCGFW